MKYNLKIAFLGDYNHPNAQSWIESMRAVGGCEIIEWSLPITNNRAGRLARILSWAKSLITIRYTLKKMNPDIVIAYRITSYGFIGAVSGFHPLVIASQGGGADIWPLNSFSTPFKRWMAKYSIKKADLVQAWGQHMADAQIALGADPKKILVLPRGIYLDKFYPPSVPLENKELNIVVTRSLYSEYYHIQMLQAVALLKKAGIPSKLHIIGTGAEMDNLKNSARELDIENEVIFYGRINNKELPEILRKCDVYTSMVHSEGVSASLFEAMACGCYPVVSDIKAMPFWITNGLNGTLVPINDVEKLFEGYKNAWENRDYRLKAIAYNIALVNEKGSLVKNMKTFVNRYEDVVKSSKK